MQPILRRTLSDFYPLGPVSKTGALSNNGFETSNKLCNAQSGWSHAISLCKVTGFPLNCGFCCKISLKSFQNSFTGSGAQPSCS